MTLAEVVGRGVFAIESVRVSPPPHNQKKNYINIMLEKRNERYKDEIYTLESS